MALTDWERADGELADAEISLVRAELLEIMASANLAFMLGMDGEGQGFADQAQEFLLSNLDAWQIVRFILQELYEEYNDKAEHILTGMMPCIGREK